MEKEFSPTLLKKCFGKQIVPAVLNLTDNISKQSQIVFSDILIVRTKRANFSFI
jgi:hypothetical protein